jgi:transmembrane sensor
VNHPIEKLVSDFWENKLSLEEREALLQKLDDSHPEWMQQLGAGFHASSAETTHQKQDEFFKKQFELLQHSIAEKTAQPAVIKSMRPAYIKWWWAAATIFFSIGIASLFFINDPHRNTSATQQQALSNLADEIKTFKLVNTTANQMQATLSDGTLLVMHPASELSYTSEYGKNIRAISLVKGKAFFKVAKDKKHPFIVSVSGIEVKALGTAFTIDKSSVDKVSVHLAEGRVSVIATAESKMKMQDVFLMPGDNLLIDIDKKSIHTDNAATVQKTLKPNISPALPVKTHNIPQLDFNQQELKQVFAQLMAYYRISIVFTEEDVKDLWFTGTFKSGDSMQIVLGTVCKVNGLVFRHDNGSFIISKKAPAQ